jgi:tetratricopeptide (TPR) repeat protein
LHDWCNQRPRPIAVAAFAVSAGLLCACAASSQSIAIRTSSAPETATVVAPTGRSAARLTPITRSPELLVLFVPETLSGADAQAVRTFTTAVFQAVHLKIAMRIGILNGTALNAAGPFRNSTDLLAAFRELKFDSDPAQPPEAGDLLDRIAQVLEAVPSNWGSTVIVGHVPAFPGNADPEVPQYAAAWLAAEFNNQKRSVSFWTSPDETPQAFLTLAATASGGSVIQKAADLTQQLFSPDPLTGIAWSVAPPKRGFRLESVRIEGVTALDGVEIPAIVAPVASASDSPGVSAIPAILPYAGLRAATARIAAALAAPELPPTAAAESRKDLELALGVNPSDWAAVKLGVDLFRRTADVGAEMALLKEAVELKASDSALWHRLGDLQYDRKDFPQAEASLLRARELGVAGARISEQLGRIRYDNHDYIHAEPFIDESLQFNPKQQALWFLAADTARLKASKDSTGKQIQSLEQGLALGGRFVERRAELIRLYLVAGDNPSASGHADRERPNLPADADTQAVWAGFYQQLGRPEDALDCWSRAVQADPRREPSHAAITAILLDLKRYPEALAAADRGLEVAAGSARLQLARARALEHTGRIYEARHSLDAFAPKTSDLDLLRYHAELQDVFGGPAAAAYRRVAEELAKAASGQPQLRQVLERGYHDALRDSDAQSAAWFAGQLAGERGKAGKPQRADLGVWVPGGLDALLFIARGNQSRGPQQFMLDYCRTVIVNEPLPNSPAAMDYRKSIGGYFEQLNRLLAMGVKNGDKTVIALSLGDKGRQRQVDGVLEILGWKLRRNKQALVIESGEKASQAKKQDLASALAIDQAGMQAAFQAGKTFALEIPWDWAPLVVEEATLRGAVGADKWRGGVLETFAFDPDLAQLYIGLSSLDPPSADALLAGVGIKQLSEKYSGVLRLYSSALTVSAGRVLTPGGPAADANWTQLVGAPPTTPVPFFRALITKDSGNLLAYFFALSQLDGDHQRFFTNTPERTQAFYKLFVETQAAEGNAGTRLRKGSFAGFLREVPLQDGHVAFPGGPEVWMVARGSSNSQGTQKLLNKAHQAAAPDVEDAVLLHLAFTRYHTQTQAVATEMDNFLAVVRIEAHRSQPLEPEAALLLAQNYALYGTFYPYFTAFRSLTTPDFQSFFNFASRIASMDEILADLVLGQFHALTELTRLGMESGALSEERGAQVFRALCARFTGAPEAASYASASLDTLNDLVGPTSDPNAALARLVLGSAAPVPVAWNGAERTLDEGHRRAVAYGRVLDLQKAPSAAALLQIASDLRQIAGGAPPAPLADSIGKQAALLPSVEIPKGVRFEGHSREPLAREIPEKLPHLVADLRQKAAKKKVDLKELDKVGREILAELGPQIRLALAGIVYAVYLSPEDSLAANDPLLLRKHLSFDLIGLQHNRRFVAADLSVSSENGGSRFTGGFAGFATAAGGAAAIGVHKGLQDSFVYASQIGSIRGTPWSHYGDEDQRILGLRLRIAREWCLYAAERPELSQPLADDLAGILSLSRRREVLNGIAGRDWETVWRHLSLSDLVFLSGRYLARYPRSPWDSPVDAALRSALVVNNGANVSLLGPLLLFTNGCDHPHLTQLAPYEEYERHFFPVEIAERSAEMKLYLSELLDRLGLPAAAMGALSEPVAKLVFRSMQMSDDHDWASVLAAFRSVNEKTLDTVLEGWK